MLANTFQKLKEKYKELITLLYLRLSDCDGMCEHCEPQLKELCLWWKGKTDEDLQLIKKVHSYRKKLEHIEDLEERKPILKWLADYGAIDSRYEYAMLAADLEEKNRYLKMAADGGYPAARYESEMPMEHSEKRKNQLKSAADQGSPYHMYEYAISVSDRDEKLLYLTKAAGKKFVSDVSGDGGGASGADECDVE